MKPVRTIKKIIYLGIGGCFLVSWANTLSKMAVSFKLSAEDKAELKQEFNDYLSEKGIKLKEKLTDSVKNLSKDAKPDEIENVVNTVKSIGRDIEKETGVTFEEASVIRVVDGDTLVLNINGEDKKVRLIGVDTPESVAKAEYLKKTGKKNTIEGIEASDFTKNLLKGVEKVYLQRDKNATEKNGYQDKYGRELYYVWLTRPDNPYDTEEIALHMLNGILVSTGYAESKHYKPNLEYSEVFDDLMEEGFDYTEER